MNAAPDWRPRLTRHCLQALGIGAFALAAAGLWTLTRTAPAPTATPVRAALEALHGACMRDMLASTCTVVINGSASAAAALARPGEVVFVAGVGAIDAASYTQLYAAGDAMCGLVRAACTRDWASGQCLTARKLWAS